MNYRIYIQTDGEPFPIYDWAVSAYLGFKKKQANIIFFNSDDVDSVPSYNSILVADIQTTSAYLSRFNVPPKLAINIPKEIEHYAGRNISRMTMKEFLETKNTPIFVKPDRFSKEFVAGVVSDENNKKYFFNEIGPDVPVLTSEVVDFVSEYRGYVIDKKLVGLKHYFGNFEIFPDTKVIHSAINDFKSQPSAYSIDFGITSDGRTLLIECNDGYALGNYGLDDILYSRLLATRWIEIMKSII